MLAAALYVPEDLIKSVDDFLPTLEKVWGDEDCQIMWQSGYNQRKFPVCLNGATCERKHDEHRLSLKWHLRVLLSDCVRSEKPDIRTLIHIIFGRDPKRPDHRLQISHYCLLQHAATCCHPQHFALETDRDNKRRVTHQHGGTVCDCREKWNAEPCIVNGRHVKVYKDGAHIGWNPRRPQV